MNSRIHDGYTISRTSMMTQAYQGRRDTLWQSILDLIRKALGI